MKKKESKKEVKKDLKKEKKVEKKESLFKQIKKEMSKVHFPNKKDMVKYSLATISFVLFFGIYFYVIELVMALVKSLV
ncbi:MAG: preprotein translocase subunit SecE [Bacilli bacterium]|nr:preprotein translocase subunit SecE [Bacilli bacterium]